MVGGTSACISLGGFLIHLLGQLIRRGCERLHGGFDRGRLLAFHGLAHGCNRIRDLILVLLADFVAVLGQVLFGAIDQTIRVVPGLGQVSPLFVIFGVYLGVLDQPLDLFFAEPARCSDFDRLFFVRAQVLGRDVHDTIRVNVERHFDLRQAARGRGDPNEIELTEQLVVVRHFALPLAHPDRHRALVVSGGGEDLALLGRNRRVAINQVRKDAAQGLNSQRERGDVQEQHVLDLSFQDARLNAGADCHDLVRIDALVRLLPEKVAHRLDHLRHPGHPADEHHLLDIAGGHACVVQGFLAGFDGLLNEITD